MHNKLTVQLDSGIKGIVALIFPLLPNAYAQYQEMQINQPNPHRVSEGLQRYKEIGSLRLDDSHCHLGSKPVFCQLKDL